MNMRVCVGVMNVFGVGRGSVLELQQLCEEFYGNHVDVELDCCSAE